MPNVTHWHVFWGIDMIVIAMTREIGSRGTEVAAELAGRLRLRIIDSEIVANSVAQRLGVEETAVTRYVDGSASIFERMRLNRRKLCRYTVEEILRLAQFGNVLIRGWGAATLLQNIPHVISVRVCAPMEHRVRVVMERIGGEDADTVRQEIERYEVSRRRAMRGLFMSRRRTRACIISS
jgi:cytidylate kinase